MSSAEVGELSFGVPCHTEEKLDRKFLISAHKISSQ